MLPPGTQFAIFGHMLIPNDIFTGLMGAMFCCLVPLAVLCIQQKETRLTVFSVLMMGTGFILDGFLFHAILDTYGLPAALPVVAPWIFGIYVAYCLAVRYLMPKEG